LLPHTRARAHTHTQVSRMAISKPAISHIFSNLKPSACRPYGANNCTAGDLA
jgi:hypothetical protein